MLRAGGTKRSSRGSGKYKKQLDIDCEEKGWTREDDCKGFDWKYILLLGIGLIIVGLAAAILLYLILAVDTGCADCGHGNGNENGHYKPSHNGACDSGLPDWPMANQNTNGDHHISDNDITKKDAQYLGPACLAQHSSFPDFEPTTALVGQSSNAAPIMVGDVLFWTGYGGRVGASYMPERGDKHFDVCDIKWQRDVRDVLNITFADPNAAPASRIAPAYYEGAGGKGQLFYTGPANVFTYVNVFNPVDFLDALKTPLFVYVLDAETGELQWKTQVTQPGLSEPSDIYPSSLSQPSVHNGVAYFGVSSLNNFFAQTPEDGTFRGLMIAVDLNTHNVKWIQRTIPEKPERWQGPWFSGGGV